ncbi:MAG: alpha/beta fold hydrolase [Nocardioides sp.]|uniref:alpha/beta fold hydrolase n=1 Tax=Nocardioides sp. TaxID=35761 RepID=UPI0039E3F5CD
MADAGVASRTVWVDGRAVAVWERGEGPTVVLLHAAWGSGEHWQPQLEPLAEAGFHALAWSRRGHLGSDPGPAEETGTFVDDLAALLDALGLDRVHLVGTAFGGFGAAAIALLLPHRLLSLTLAASICGIADPDFRAETDALVPAEIEALPPQLRELSAAYRYADPAGAARWAALTQRAVPTRVHQPVGAEVTRTGLGAIRVPTRFIAGEADLYMPPARMARLAEHLPGSRLGVVPAAGHSPSWENPAAFNDLLLEHLVSAR